MENDKLVTLVFENRCLWDMKNKNCHNRDLSHKKWNKISKEIDAYLVASRVHEISCGIPHKCLLKQTLHSHVHFFQSEVIFLTKDYPKLKIINVIHLVNSDKLGQNTHSL
jgi:hypothetical protein